MSDLAVPSYGSVLLRMLRPDVESNVVELATGTGFVVNGPGGWYLVTNWHVVTGRDPSTGKPIGRSAAVPSLVDVDFHNPDDISSPATHRYPLYDGAGAIWLTHPQLGRAADVVALKIGIGGAWTQHAERPVQIAAYELEVGRPMRFEPTAEVSVIGYPYGRRSTGSLGIWARGTIASEPELDFASEPVVLIDTRSRKGQSGSPVVAYRPAHALVHFADGHSAVLTGPTWELLGVYSGRINEESDLGKVWKRKVIEEVVRGATRDSFEFS